MVIVLMNAKEMMKEDASANVLNMMKIIKNVNSFVKPKLMDIVCSNAIKMKRILFVLQNVLNIQITYPSVNKLAKLMRMAIALMNVL